MQGAEMPRGSFEGRVTGAVEMAEGRGATVKRAFPNRRRGPVDPFVLLDEFTVAPDAGFPEHPHGGFEALTYVLDGSMEHRDSTGESTSMESGGVQRMTTGAGIRHSEMPGPEGGHGLQLWVNLPLEEKESEPRYRFLSPDEIPVRTVDGAEIRTVVGEGSPVELRVDAEYRIVEAGPGASYVWEVPAGRSGVLYVVSGEIDVGEEGLGAGELAVHEGEEELEAPSSVPRSPCSPR